MQGNVYRNKRGYTFFASLILLIFVLSTFSCSVYKRVYRQTFEEATEEQKQTLDKICSELAPPLSFTKIRDRKIAKPHMITYSVEYNSEAEPNEVERYYSDMLIPKGWEYSEENEILEKTMIFRKGDYKIAIYYSDLFPFSKTNSYITSCSWSVLD